jgi:tetratricopeptide (TPR) repeat protein
VTARPVRRRAPAPARRSWLSLDGAAEISAGEERVLVRLAWALAAILVAALLYLVIGPHRVGDYMTETDFYGAYAQGARLIQHGQLLPSRYGVIGPGYEVMLAVLGLAIGDLFVASELMSVAATAITLLLWFDLLRRRANARVAFLAALFMATNAYLFRHGYGAMTDAPAIALQAAALHLLLTRGSGRAMLGAGLLSAAAFLTRYNAIYLVPTGLIALLAGGAPVARRGRAALLFAAGFLAPLVPWVLYSLAHGGGFSLQLHHNIAYEVFARARNIPWDVYQRDMQPQFRTLWDVIAHDPGAVARRMLFNIGDHLRLDVVQLLSWPVGLAAALGLLFGWRDGTLRRLWPLGVAWVLLFATLVPVFYSERYSLALLPIYATLAGIAFASPVFALVAGQRRRVGLKPLLAALPLAAALAATWRVQANVFDQLPVEVLECAKTLRTLRQPGDRVIARKLHIAYHGGVDPLAFPFAKQLPELARYARENRARWLFFSWPEAETRPDFEYLLDTTATVPGLTVRCSTRPHPAVLYEIGADFGKTPGWFANDTLVAWHNASSELLLDGGNPKLLYRVGGLAWMMGRHAEARKALELVVRLQPDNLDALLLLGSTLVSMGDAARARLIYTRAASVSPGSPDAQLGLGWSALIAGRAEEAGRLWRPLISATRNPELLHRMVALYRALGDHEAEAEALTTLRRIGGAP